MDLNKNNGAHSTAVDCRPKLLADSYGLEKSCVGKVYVAVVVVSTAYEQEGLIYREVDHRG